MSATDEKSRIRSWIRIHNSVVRIPGSGSVTKYHGSTTLLLGLSSYGIFKAPNASWKKFEKVGSLYVYRWLLIRAVKFLYCYRVDTTLLGFDQNSWIRGSRTYIFTGSNFLHDFWVLYCGLLSQNAENKGGLLLLQSNLRFLRYRSTGNFCMIFVKLGKT